jgi:NAD(P)-dependent dehydrogenase (short-subunit alcohol dehydrogenase family)
MAKRFIDKVVLVTGAGSGIGRASALKFALEGANVVVSDIIAEGGNETVRLIRKAGGEATFIKADVSLATDVETLIQSTVETYGRLDYAHNNAGISGDLALIGAYDEGDFDRVLSINLKGVWLCLKFEIIQMLKQGGGAIVNTSSQAGLAGSVGMSAYVSSKHGVIGLTKVAALEYAQAGIRVNAVCPGVIDTPLIQRFSQEAQEKILQVLPINRLGRSEEVANAVAWLCSDEAVYITGIALSVDGGVMAQCPVPNVLSK